MSTKIIFTFLSIAFAFVSCEQTNEELFAKAYSLAEEKKYDEAIKTYSKIIKHNPRIQSAYYNRGLAFVALKNYTNAFLDFNEIISLQVKDGVIFTYNQNVPFADEEVKSQVSYEDALYQRAQTYYFLDSLNHAFNDFQILIDKNYTEKSNCILWQGTILIGAGENEKACQYFAKAKESGLNTEDKIEADKMIASYCNQSNNSR